MIVLELIYCLRSLRICNEMEGNIFTHEKEYADILLVLRIVGKFVLLESPFCSQNYF